MSRRPESPTERRTLTKPLAVFGPSYPEVRRCTAVPEKTTSEAKGHESHEQRPHTRRYPRVLQHLP